MPMSEHEVTEVREVHLSWESGLLSLWDQEAPGSILAVALVGADRDHIEIHTDPTIVSNFLDFIR